MAVLIILQEGSFFETLGKNGHFFSQKQGKIQAKKDFFKKTRENRRFSFSLHSWSIYSAFISSGPSVNKIIHDKAKETS